MKKTDARSQLMSRVRRQGTLPELAFRSALGKKDVRFSINSKTLPGSPDIYSKRKRISIFIHGCFWHNHTRCRFATVPKINDGFWRDKFRRNKIRDAEKRRQLRMLGYKVVTVWECQSKTIGSIARVSGRIAPLFGRSTDCA